MRTCECVLWLHAVVAAQDVHSVRDLPVHPGPVSVLPAGAAALAELHPAQPQLQRLLRQGERLDSLLLTPTVQQRVCVQLSTSAYSMTQLAFAAERRVNVDVNVNQKFLAELLRSPRRRSRVTELC